VFFDFGAEFPLWCLFPKSPNQNRYVGPFPRQSFVDLHNGNLTPRGQTFSELMKTLHEIVFAYENPTQQTVRMTVPQRQSAQRQIIIPQKLSRRDIYRINSARKRFRF
jgi:hypothetical protein